MDGQLETIIPFVAGSATIPAADFLAPAACSPHHGRVPQNPLPVEKFMPQSRHSIQKIRLGVSACLLGQEVRYDGGHTYNSFIAETLGEVCDLVPVCPESELGMGTPRETVDLVGDIKAPHMVGTHTRTDWTKGMNKWSGVRARELASDHLCGYVFKRTSPSCGVFKVKVFQAEGPAKRQGRGLFAAEFSRRYPLVPLEEEVRLQDPRHRENFVVRVFALHRLQEFFGGRWSRAALAEFHASQKFLLLAHDPKGLKSLDHLMASSAKKKPAALRDQYMALTMSTLAKHATVSKQTKVLRQLASLLRPHLGQAELQRLHAAIEEYKTGTTPLIVPMTLIRHYGALHEVSEVVGQSYLDLHAGELLLRNRV